MCVNSLRMAGMVHHVTPLFHVQNSLAFAFPLADCKKFYCIKTFLLFTQRSRFLSLEEVEEEEDEE